MQFCSLRLRLCHTRGDTCFVKKKNTFLNKNPEYLVFSNTGGAARPAAYGITPSDRPGLAPGCMCVFVYRESMNMCSMQVIVCVQPLCLGIRHAWPLTLNVLLLCVCVLELQGSTVELNISDCPAVGRLPTWHGQRVPSAMQQRSDLQTHTGSASHRA